ncbi:hypothetical protein UNH65_19210 [Chitinophaga sp. 180180018-2]|nr:hypothetical protein [Chitinophaga sp. 212800010-3]
MNVNNKKIAIVIMMSLIVTACNKSLDMPPDGRVSLNQIFSDYDLSRGYLNRCYSYMPYGGTVGDYAMSYNGTLLASFSDEAEDVQNSQSGGLQNWYLGNVSASAFPMADYWSQYYEGIRACNIFLKGIEDAAFVKKRPALAGEVQGWKAQVLVLRAFYYWQILKRYGPAPVISQSLDDQHDFSQYKRPPFSECVDSVIADCDKAIADGLMWQIGLGQEGDRGSMTRAVAYAIESEAALYAASDLWNTSAAKDEQWRRAALLTGKALSECLANGYQLFTEMPSGEVLASSQSAYQTFFFSHSDPARIRDKETILECKNQLTIWRDAALPVNNGAVKAGACPSQEIVDAYEMADGHSPFMLDNNGSVIYDGVSPRINTASGYDPDHPYNNRDPRLAATIYFNGALLDFTNPGSALQVYNNGNCGVSYSDQRYTRTGYYLRKYHNNRSNISNQADGYMKIFRLAELYLNFAEAANEAYGPVATVPGISGPVATALAAVNTVRSRAGMPAFDATGSLTQSGFRARYRNERRVELSFEQHRFFDVRRWKILEKTDQQITGMNISRKPDGTFNYANARFSVDSRRSNATRFLLFPLPFAEVSKMERYTGANWQNPGW